MDKFHRYQILLFHDISSNTEPKASTASTLILGFCSFKNLAVQKSFLQYHYMQLNELFYLISLLPKFPGPVEL
jgi:hypothetical protein